MYSISCLYLVGDYSDGINDPEPAAKSTKLTLPLWKG